MSPRERLDHRIRDKKIARARIRDALRERDGCHCAYCGVALVEDDPMRGESLDHLVPRSRGGSDDLENLALSCRSCNSQKGTRTAHEFVLSGIGAACADFGRRLGLCWIGRGE